MSKIIKYSINIYVLYNDFNKKIVKRLLYKERFYHDDMNIDQASGNLSKKIIFNNKRINYECCFQIKEEIMQLIIDSSKYNEKMLKQITNEIDPMPTHPIILKELIIFLKKKKIDIDDLVGYVCNINVYFENNYSDKKNIFHLKKLKKEVSNDFCKITKKEINKSKNNNFFQYSEKVIDCNKIIGIF